MLTAGMRVGAYEIVGSLGAGGMGLIYRARDPKLGRDVALKVLPEEFAADPERVVERLAWPEVVPIGGIETRALERIVLAAFTDLVSETQPRALFETFRYFDGRRIATVLEDIETSEGIRLDPALVRHLVDFRILVAPDAPSSGH